MSHFAQSFHDIFLQQIHRRLRDEGLSRLRKCLGILTEEEIWYRPNNHSNSVGNLTLHLCGNVRQWLISTLGQETDRRDRPSEFAERGPLPTQQLLDLLDQLEKDVVRVLDQISPEDLLNDYRVQGYEETGISILIHVVEHFSYHVGQVGYFVKARKDMDLGYYAGRDLNVTS